MNMQTNNYYVFFKILFMILYLIYCTGQRKWPVGYKWLSHDVLWQTQLATSLVCSPYKLCSVFFQGTSGIWEFIFYWLQLPTRQFVLFDFNHWLVMVIFEFGLGTVLYSLNNCSSSIMSPSERRFVGVWVRPSFEKSHSPFFSLFTLVCILC